MSPLMSLRRTEGALTRINSRVTPQYFLFALAHRVAVQSSRRATSVSQIPVGEKFINRAVAAAVIAEFRIQ
jgi:hypothetical protein